MKKRGDLNAILLLLAVWALVVAVVGLGGDYALNDDWAYAYSARHLAQTGELRILDWAAPSLLTHALWGAAVIRAFGDSYVALRCGTLVWAFSALVCLYGLARTALPARTAVIVPLCLALSPWFVNLSFTYMTDVHWLAIVLAALVVFVHALDPGASAPPRAGLLVLSGLLVGAAATTRQIAIITTPAFALALALDARRRSTMGAPERVPQAPPSGARWLPATVRSCFIFGAPVGLVFFPFYHWYSHVHGATQATRETLQHITDVRPWTALILSLSVLHYAGLWLSPLLVAFFLRHGNRAWSKLGEVVTRRQAGWALFFLGAYAVVRPILGPLVDPRGMAHFDHPGDVFHPFMPYLGNIVYLVGVGPPTITDLYRISTAHAPHSALWLGVLLTLASLAGGAFGAGLLMTTLRRIRQTWALGRAPAQPAVPEHRRDVLRVLCISFASCYLLFQLCTSTFIFDRYLLPILPLVVLLGLDAAPPELGRSPAFVGWLVLSGLFSLGGTREYLSWNAARDRAVRALIAAGIPASDIDGGFEVNAPVYFEAYRRRTGELLGDNAYFWREDAPYRLSFFPSQTPGCSTRDRYPYWTWPGGGDRAMYVLQCTPAVAGGGIRREMTTAGPPAAAPGGLTARREAGIVVLAVAVFAGVGWFKAARHPYPFFDDPDFLYLGSRIREAGGPLGLLRDLYAGRFTESNRHPLQLALLSLFARPEVGYHRDAQVLAIALGAAALVACWWAARRHFGRAAAAILAVMLSGSGALLWTASLECSDALLVVFYALAVSAILDGASDPSPDGPRARRAWLAAGLWSGIAYLAKGPGLFLPICLALTLLVHERLRPLRELRTWLFGGGFVLAGSPLLWRNLRVYGSPIYHENSQFLWIDRLPDYAEVYAPHALARMPHGGREYFARVTARALGWRLGMGLGETTFHLGDAMALVSPRPAGGLNIFWVVVGVIATAVALRSLWRGERGFLRTFMLVHFGWWFAFLAFFNAAGGASRYFLPLVTTTVAPALAAHLAQGLDRAGSFFRSRKVAGLAAAVALAIASTLALDPSPTRPPAGYLEVQDWLVRHVGDGEVYAVDARTHLRPGWITPRAHQLIVSAAWKDRPVPADELLSYLCEKQARYVVLDAEAQTTSVEAGASRARYLFYDLLALEPDGSLPLQGFPGRLRPVYVGSESPRRWMVLETSCAATALYSSGRLLAPR